MDGISDVLAMERSSRDDREVFETLVASGALRVAHFESSISSTRESRPIAEN